MIISYLDRSCWRALQVGLYLRADHPLQTDQVGRVDQADPELPGALEDPGTTAQQYTPLRLPKPT